MNSRQIAHCKIAATFSKMSSKFIKIAPIN